MSTFKITTDSNADLPEGYIAEHNLDIVTLNFTIDGETYNREHNLPVDEFYARMRNGSLPTTAQVNPVDAKEIFEPLLATGTDVLHIAFSSALSGSYNSCRLAAEELREKYPDRRVYVVDSLCASLGQGLFIHKAVEMQTRGEDIDTVCDWLEAHKLNVVHNFTVDDLNHLYRGGRVSKTAAVIGTIVNIKPILHVDNEGRLVALSKIRGRKKSLHALVENMENQVGSWRDKNDIVFISHGDCEADAQYVADLVREKFGIENFLINYVGPAIGAHSGPGTLALFFMGDTR
ncbi:MAG: DegV family protein [Lachnospiraceae bacterium]